MLAEALRRRSVDGVLLTEHDRVVTPAEVAAVRRQTPGLVLAATEWSTDLGRILVLDIYTRPLDPRRPVLCLDETSRQLLGEVTPALLVAPGHSARQDNEYVRGGVVNLFLVAEPLRGWKAFGANHLLPGSDFPVLLSYENYERTFSWIREVGLPQADVDQILERTAPSVLQFGTQFGRHASVLSTQRGQ